MAGGQGQPWPPTATLVAMGSFKPDALPIGDLAKNTVAAQKVFDRAGWK
jgi:iron(III) transport system substrate-binding protein